MQGNEYTLPNGLRIIHEPTLSKVAYCGFAIDAGTRDEAANEQGMAHFVEHLIFKGTVKRKAWHILNRMENVGGDLNAYTNKEETVVYSAFLTEHLERALELLGDIVFHSTFPQHEIEKETEVIIDEIQSYEDTPSELIFDDFEDMIFRNHHWEETFLVSRNFCGVFARKMSCPLPVGSISRGIWCFSFKDNMISRKLSVWQKNICRIFLLWKLRTAVRLRLFIFLNI